MKKLLLCIALCLMMIACGNTKKTKEIQLSEPEEQSVTEDSAGKKTIVIDGVVYELTEKSI